MALDIQPKQDELSRWEMRVADLERRIADQKGGGRARFSSAEIFETLGKAIYMGASPSVMHAAHAVVDAYKQFAKPEERNAYTSPPPASV